MWAYLDRSLGPRPTEELETHLDACKRCCGELEFSRELRGLVAMTSGPALADEVRDRIEQLIATGRERGPEQ